MRCEAGRWEPTWSEPRSRGTAPRIFVVSSLAFDGFAECGEHPRKLRAANLLQSACPMTTCVGGRKGDQSQSL